MKQCCWNLIRIKYEDQKKAQSGFVKQNMGTVHKKGEVREDIKTRALKWVQNFVSHRDFSLVLRSMGFCLGCFRSFHNKTAEFPLCRWYPDYSAEQISSGQTLLSITSQDNSRLQQNEPGLTLVLIRAQYPDWREWPSGKVLIFLTTSILNWYSGLPIIKRNKNYLSYSF